MHFAQGPRIPGDGPGRRTTPTVRTPTLRTTPSTTPPLATRSTTPLDEKEEKDEEAENGREEEDSEGVDSDSDADTEDHDSGHGNGWIVPNMKILLHIAQIADLLDELLFDIVEICNAYFEHSIRL